MNVTVPVLEFCSRRVGKYVDLFTQSSEVKYRSGRNTQGRMRGSGQKWILPKIRVTSKGKQADQARNGKERKKLDQPGQGISE